MGNFYSLFRKLCNLNLKIRRDLQNKVLWKTVSGSQIGKEENKIYRGYYMPTRGYEFYHRVVNSISHK